MKGEDPFSMSPLEVRNVCSSDASFILQLSDTLVFVCLSMLGHSTGPLHGYSKEPSQGLLPRQSRLVRLGRLT